MDYSMYTFSKSFRTISCMNNIMVNINLFTSKDPLFHESIDNSNLTLSLLENSLLGIFLTNSELMILNSLQVHQTYLDKEGKNKNIIKLPNILDPRLNNYFLEIPKMINLPIHSWDNNFRTLIIEIDPQFPDIKLLEDVTEDIKQCKNCKVGFKESENNCDSCVFHPGEIRKIGLTNYWSCCGTNIQETNNDLIWGCKQCYHI